MDFERNRSRINQLIELGMVEIEMGFKTIGCGYSVSNYLITHSTDLNWAEIVRNLPAKQTDQEAFDSYIKRLNDIKAPVLADKRLSEIVDIMNDLIIEYTSYTKQELRGVEPLCYQLADKIKSSKTE